MIDFSRMAGMYQEVRQNFEEKVSYIARTVTGMMVNIQWQIRHFVLT